MIVLAALTALAVIGAGSAGAHPLLDITGTNNKGTTPPSPAFSAQSVTKPTVVANIAVGNSPYFNVLDPATKRLYIPNAGAESVSVIDTASHAVTTTLNVTGGIPTIAAVHPGANKVYVTVTMRDVPTNKVAVIDTTTDTITGYFDVGPRVAGIAVDAGRNIIYTTTKGDSKLSAYDGTTYALLNSVTVGSGPSGIGVNATTNTLYVANFDGNTVSVVDGNTFTVTATWPVKKMPTEIVVDEDTGNIYVSNLRSNVVWMMSPTGALLRKLKASGNPAGMYLDPATKDLYVARMRNRSVARFDGTTFKRQNIKVGKGNPIDVAYDPDSKQLFVSMVGIATVTVVQLP